MGEKKKPGFGRWSRPGENCFQRATPILGPWPPARQHPHAIPDSRQARRPQSPLAAPQTRASASPLPYPCPMPFRRATGPPSARAPAIHAMPYPARGPLGGGPARGHQRARRNLPRGEQPAPTDHRQPRRNLPLPLKTPPVPKRKSAGHFPGHLPELLPSATRPVIQPFAPTAGTLENLARTQPVTLGKSAGAGVQPIACFSTNS